METMKKVTVESNFHTGCTATFYVPSYIEDSRDAMVWLDSEAHREWSIFGRYGAARAKQLRIQRALCGVKGCMCGVKVEEFE